MFVSTKHVPDNKGKSILTDKKWAAKIFNPRRMFVSHSMAEKVVLLIHIISCINEAILNLISSASCVGKTPAVEREVGVTNSGRQNTF